MRPEHKVTIKHQVELIEPQVAGAASTVSKKVITKTTEFYGTIFD
jgi:hypothetical protein